MNDKASFNEYYAGAVKRAMSALGEGASSITSYIEKKYNMTLADTADKPKVLAEALDAAIDGGARVIERRILRFLYEAIDIIPKSAMTIDFEKQILEARRAFEAKSHVELT